MGIGSASTERPDTREVYRGPAAKEARAELERRGQNRRFADRLFRAAQPFRGVFSFGDAELDGVKLDEALLSEEETKELRGLAKQRRQSEEDFPPADRARYEQLVGLAAGDPDLFQHKREEAEMKAKLQDAAEKLHRSTLPRRPKLEQPGSVTLPAFLFKWMTDGRLDSWSLADTAAVAAILWAFELEDARLFGRATFERQEGEPTIVISDATARLGFGAGVDPDDAIPLAQCFLCLEANKWIVQRWESGTLHVQLGERARKLRAGTA